ncbi:alpha/beta hydrolase family protein [Cohnella cholangitidis]|uniref:MFS transporter n=1 Tax=Cohnella cholangitidis TaxID=2598458 RepID=A0A7G5BXX8_9BACL|nr:alpha/beta hydrolase [Cohnella cholangitidis]QMV41812.1 MFS transporter [Cohnella cholangitidis]
MNLEYIEISKSKRIASWLRQRLTGTYALDTGVSRFIVVSMWLFSCLAVAVAAVGMPTGFGVTFDVVTGMALNTVALAIASAGIGGVLALLGLGIPRFTAGSFIYTGVLVYFVLYFSEFGWKGALIYSTACTFVVAALGALTGAIGRLRPTNRKAALVSLAALIVVAGYALAGFPRLLPSMSNSQADEDRADGADYAKSNEVRASGVILQDPSLAGDYPYRFFTYASGEDRHRSEFGRKTDELSSSVDASAYIENWPWLRSRFWGFDETRLPLNGRVWMPDGKGPFPLVLMVHGNHLMEKFSDGGYEYLGELLASRGIIAISVDENFLNYSVWSGIPKQDMKLRAWMLLKHIDQIQRFSEQSESPFFGRVDFERIALLGHSRGGQAAAMAAGRNQWFADDDRGLPETGSYSIRAVVALAPTDTAVEDKWTELRDVSYLTLQGAKDADLVNFYGDRQYGRITFAEDAESEAFKASLYIEDANHSQFNTEWGESDNAWPAGLFIRPKELIEPDEQRRIAKAYVSAFLETVLNDDERYEALFRDYRNGLSFLPDTRYFNQYESGSFRRIADFAGDDRTNLSPGLSAEAADLTDWRHANAMNRQGKGKGDRGVELAWEEEGSYTIRLSSVAASEMDNEDILMFSLANMGLDLEEETKEEAEEPAQWEALEEAIDSRLSIEVELEDRSGEAVRLSLDDFMETEPQVATEFTWLPGMESVLSEGKFKDAEEPVYQTYELPIEAFLKANPDFDPEEWAQITFYFNEGPGKIMLDDLGLMAG